jgi:hypothetical protein
MASEESNPRNEGPLLPGSDFLRVIWCASEMYRGPSGKESLKS